MKKPPVEELSRVRKLLADKQHHSPFQLRVWRKAHAKLKRKVEAAFRRVREKEEGLGQFTLKLK